MQEKTTEVTHILDIIFIYLGTWGPLCARLSSNSIVCKVVIIVV